MNDIFYESSGKKCYFKHFSVNQNAVNFFIVHSSYLGRLSIIGKQMKYLNEKLYCLMLILTKYSNLKLMDRDMYTLNIEQIQYITTYFNVRPNK